MRCPRCHVDDTKVIDSREAEEGSSIRRRRVVLGCAHRFTTYERLEEVPLVVVKSHGAREPFDRAKLVAGVSRPRKGRPVTAEQIEAARRASRGRRSAERHRGHHRPTSASRCSSGCASLDEVAYLRFASVYKDFDAAADFQRELVLLKKLQRS